MRKTYTLEIKVVLDESDELKAIRVAREHYRATGGAQTPVDNSLGIWSEIPAEESISDVPDAIIELIQGQALCEQAGIELISMTVGENEPTESCSESGQSGSVSAESRES